MASQKQQKQKRRPNATSLQPHKKITEIEITEITNNKKQ
jgi:hypothetical protein